MKKYILIIVLVLIAILGYTFFDLLVYRPATEEQKTFLTSKLNATQKIIIRVHPKIGGAVLAEITDKPEIDLFVSATRISEVGAPCACFSTIQIVFVLPSGESFLIGYTNFINDKHINFKNPWYLQAKLPDKLRMLVKKYTESV